MKRSVVLVLTLLMVSPLWASNAKSKNKKAPPVEEKKEVVVIPLGELSLQNRQNKNTTLTYQLFGSGPTWAQTGTFTAGSFLTPNLILQAEVGRGKASNYLKLFDDTQVRSIHVGLHMKHFVSRTLYYRVGYDYRKIELGNSYLGGVVANPDIYAYESNSGALSAYIGNQWQWQYFTLGCDWFGITLPLHYEYRHQFINNPGSPGLQTRLDKAKNEYTEQISFNFLRLYLGASF